MMVCASCSRSLAPRIGASTPEAPLAACRERKKFVSALPSPAWEGSVVRAGARDASPESSMVRLVVVRRGGGEEGGHALSEWEGVVDGTLVCC